MNRALVLTMILFTGCHRIGQTRPVAVYRLITANSVDIEMMEKQISKKKLERMTIAGGTFCEPKLRSPRKNSEC